MLLELPPHLETIITQIAEAQGITAQEVAITALQQRFAPDDEQAYYDWFYEHHFDIERLKKAIGETDENGRAKHTTEVPTWALKDLAAFDQWLASV